MKGRPRVSIRRKPERRTVAVTGAHCASYTVGGPLFGPLHFSARP
jgi:hypothetical protein